MSFQKMFLLVVVITFQYNFANAQVFTQTLRGVVQDKILQKPIENVSVQLAGTAFGDRTDASGNFSIADLPVGTYTLVATCVGYKENVLPNIMINAGKELVLTISMEERIISGKEILIKSGRKKNTPLNEMSVVSARQFSVEETQKYAAAVNDPARMATNYAGVMAGDDGNNQIVIRGNSPSGLLWRMEGIDVPNPNHFAVAGSSGGGISILSTQLLANSDFVTGAFAAEYGNALSGVFDLKLRRGNNEQREYTLQAGILGINAAAEGPFSKNYRGSYLFNYRYSTLSILSKLGISFTPSVTNFQDLSYNIYLPTNKYGHFTLFSFGGLSDQYYNAVKDSLKWENSGQRFSDKFFSNTGNWGLTHQVNLSKKTLLKTAIAYSIVKSAYDRNYLQNDYTSLNVYNQSFTTKRLALSSNLNYKINSKLFVRSGFILNHIQFMFQENSRDKISTPLYALVDVNKSTQTAQAFSQAQYKPGEKITLSVGLHFMGLMLNRTASLEPRASIKWDMSAKHSVAFGFGKHSQLQSWGVYFSEDKNSSGNIYPNRNLGMSKALHYVLSHHFSITKNLKLKTELYYQHLYHIPISLSDSNTFSAQNTQNDYIRIPLTNNGTGKNYGLEMSLEKYLHNNFYYMLSASFYQSKYIAANGREYNTRFNGNEIFNIIGGKDFVSKNRRRTFGVNLKCMYAGGYRTTPIDMQKSIQQENTVYLSDRAYTEKLPDYWRADIRVSMKWNRKRFTSTLSLDLQNATNHQNVYDRFFDTDTKSIKTYYQTGIIPILNYKVEF